MYLHRSLFAFLLLLSISEAIAQQVQKKFVFTLPDTSAEKMGHLKVDINADGTYCYYNWNSGGKVVTNSGIYGPFEKSDDRYGTVLFYNEKDKQQYIMGRHSATMYGPIDGDIDITSYPFNVG